MRKDLMLAAALTGLTVSGLRADPGGNRTSLVGGERAPIHGSTLEGSGAVSDRNAAPSSITSEVTNSGDRGSSAAQNFQGETPGTLGARGTIGQDGTGFTGQERIGTLPPGRLGFRQTNDFDKKLDDANGAIRDRERAGQLAPFDLARAGRPGNTTNHNSPVAPSFKPGGAAATPSDSGPAGLAGNAGRFNGQPVTPGSQTSAVIGHEESGAPATPQAKLPAQGAPATSATGTGTSATGKVTPNNSSEDHAMSNRIRTQLLNTALPGTTTKLGSRELQSVQVKAENGEVTLSGTVPTREEKREIESMVKEMRGVSAVKNQLTIKGADAKTDNLPDAGK